MIQVKIKNTLSKEYTHGSIFESQELAEDWIKLISSKSPCPWGVKGTYEIEVENLSDKIEQERINKQAKAFLQSTDYKVTRHRDQIEGNEPTSLTPEQFQSLLIERSNARKSIHE